MVVEGNTAGLLVLMGSAALLGLAHTVLVPDHYIPFIVLARSERWTWARAVFITALCGLGRVIGAAAIGLIGVGLGGTLERFIPEGVFHGSWSAWALILFGLGYAGYGAVIARQHGHDGEEGNSHVHTHLPTQVAEAVRHESHDCAEHGSPGGRKTVSLTPWLFFVVFLLGPCKLIVVGLLLPAMQYGTSGLMLVAAAFGITTMVTMTALVLLGSWGLGMVHLGRLEHWSHALAGAVIVVSGVLMLFVSHPQLDSHVHTDHGAPATGADLHEGHDH